MFARFDENPAMTLRVIKETKRYGRTDGQTDGQTHGRTHGRTDGRTDNVKTVYPLQTKFAGGIITTPDPGYQWESDKLTVIHHKREPRGHKSPQHTQ